MTQSLINKLIAHYEMVIARLAECNHIGTAMAYISSSGIMVQYGICHCAYKVFDNQEVYEDIWVNSHVIAGSGNHWYATPERANSITEIIHRLQARVDIMKTFKESDI